jgi:hypothetical protein
MVVVSEEGLSNTSSGGTMNRQSEMGGFIFPDKPDPRSQSLDATRAGIDCAVIRSDESFAQFLVPDNGETPFVHKVDP